MIITTLFLLTAILCIGYAACCNAKMDTVDDHYAISIYGADKHKYKQEWFDPRVSWSNDHNYESWVRLAAEYLPNICFWYITEIRKKSWDPMEDFWHWEKTKMILSLCLSSVCTLIAGIALGKHAWGIIAAGAVVYYAGIGIVWNMVFNYFYEKKLIASQFK
jgi:hypothetical protein